MGVQHPGVSPRDLQRVCAGPAGGGPYGEEGGEAGPHGDVHPWTHPGAGLPPGGGQ